MSIQSDYVKDEGTPDYLVPRMGDIPVSSASYFRTAAITRVEEPEQFTEDGNEIEPTEIDELGPFTIPRPGSVSHGLPAEGVLLTHEQSWSIQGIAFGELLHSVSLAPGEITQVAVTSAARSLVEGSTDVGQQREGLDESGQAETDISEDEIASAREEASGHSYSASSSTSVEAGAGGLLGAIGLSAGGGTNATSGHQANYSTGHRNVSDISNQAAHQNATEQARLARDRHAAGVREVSEADSLELRSRVVANYNHMHALNMQYYEVEQVYQLRTRVIDAERLLFVPMQRIDFSDLEQLDKAVSLYRDQLVSVAGELGLDDIAAKLASRGLREETLQERVNLAATEIDGLLVEHERFLQIIGDSQHLASVASDQLLAARDALRESGEVNLTGRAKLQREKSEAIATLRSHNERIRLASSQARRLKREFGVAKRRKWDAERATQMQDHELLAVMEEYNLPFNHGLWLKLDPSTCASFLHGRVFEGDKLGGTVDPEPISVSGNYLGFRWRFSDLAQAEQFREKYAFGSELKESVALPTGGIFGEAVLGESIAAEKIDLTRFWNWSDALPPIHPAAIEALGAPNTQPLQTPTLVRPPDGAINLDPLAFPEAASGSASVAAALANPDLFKDMSGTETAAALAQSALELSASGAGKSAELAGENFKRFLGFQQTLASEARKMKQKPDFDPTMAGGLLNAKQKDTPADSDNQDTSTHDPDDSGGFEVSFEEDET